MKFRYITKASMSFMCPISLLAIFLFQVAPRHNALSTKFLAYYFLMFKNSFFLSLWKTTMIWAFFLQPFNFFYISIFLSVFLCFVCSAAYVNTFFWQKDKKFDSFTQMWTQYFVLTFFQFNTEVYFTLFSFPVSYILVVHGPSLGVMSKHQLWRRLDLRFSPPYFLSRFSADHDLVARTISSNMSDIFGYLSGETWHIIV